MYLSSLTAIFALVLTAVRPDVSDSVRAVEKAFWAAKILSTSKIAFKPSVLLLEVSFPQTYGPPLTLHAGINVPTGNVGLLPVKLTFTQTPPALRRSASSDM
ncbi:hypothetical protein FB451DRAFT_1194443 [Mycena latifolia]|nr:hypothetical protein FB451DRAFT_1194443 [Mycena latifolia]